MYISTVIMPMLCNSGCDINAFNNTFSLILCLVPGRNKNVYSNQLRSPGGGGVGGGGKDKYAGSWGH